MKKIIQKVVESSSRNIPRPKYTLPDGEKILIMAPHCDDDILGCGGTIKLLQDNGKHVDILYLTDGTKGTASFSQSEALANTRKDESLCALKTLGFLSENNTIFMGCKDGELNNIFCKYTKYIKDLLVKEKYDAVFVPYVGDIHPDHRGCNRLLKSALETSMNCHNTLKIYLYEVWTPLIPNLCVDITKVYDNVERAIYCHTSQIKVHRYGEMLKGLAEYRASFVPDKKIKYVEAFYRCNMSEYINLVLDF